MKNKEEQMQLPKVTIDEFFTTQEERDIEKLERIQEIPISSITNFPNHPFQVRDDEKMIETIESIKKYGVIYPAIVRPKKDGKFEMIAGHRRKRACEVARMEKMPCIVRTLTDDEATIIMVDSNLQREEILPSERAFAYKMKLEAMNRQGQRNDLTCVQDGHKLKGKKSVEILAEEVNDSVSQIKRYVRLTYLIKDLLQLVDNQYINAKDKIKMSLTPAVELSYLKNKEQEILLDAIQSTLSTPSTPQARRLRQQSEDGNLTEEEIYKIMEEEKGNQQENVTFTYGRVKQYFPKGYTIKQMESIIEKLLKKYQLHWQKKQMENER